MNLRNYKALKQSERAAALSVQDTRELVIFAVAGTYLQTLAASSRLIFRSLVELQTQQQRLSSIESDFRKQKIALARLIGLPLDREVQLRETFSSEHVGRVVS